MNASTIILEKPESKNRVRIVELVKQASALIGPVWPLKNGIACNPLLGLEHKEFWTAIKEAELQFANSISFTKINEEKVNLHFIKWIQAFVDEGQATWRMPDRHLGFYRCWRLLVPYDRLLIRTDRDRKTLALFCEDPEKAIEFGMDHLGIQNQDRVEYLAAQLGQLPGWAGYVKWQTDWAEPSQYPIDLVQFLAVRIAISCLLEKEKQAEKKSPYKHSWTKEEIEHLEKEYRIECVRKAISCLLEKEKQAEKKSPYKHSWTKEEIEHLEKEYRIECVRKLTSEAKKETFSFRKQSPLAQLVFCIDVRSESFRKQIEGQGNWETFGFAGFFGIPISLTKNGSSEKYPSCPVLLKPAHDVLEMCCHSSCSKWMSKIKAIFHGFYKSLKYQFGTPFALAEMIGPWSGIWMTLKSLSPQTAFMLQDLDKRELSHQFSCLEKSIPLEEQVKYAKSALGMIGLTQNFAPLVIFCGHGSITQNNPHAAALNCGACGGNPGGPNARLIASILNSSKVRSELKKSGIQIPEKTLFLGAEHDTTTDHVTFFQEKTHIGKHSDLIRKLNEDLKNAQKANASIRMPLFGSSKGEREAIRKSIDWSETRPEWGLAKNAAFLVGPRTLTENLDLKSRCFLHSYDWRSDSDGTYLETILTAPMVVAEWISTQYFFSAFNPVAFGSGSKITHNVVGKIGVMQGNGSDLMHGLPLQSIHSNDMEPYHIPLRLLTVVLAPKTRIDAIVNKYVNLQNLFLNRWVHLVAIDPADLKAYQLQEQGVWNEIPG